MKLNHLQGDDIRLASKINKKSEAEHFCLAFFIAPIRSFFPKKSS